jgi:hypothetical protein
MTLGGSPISLNRRVWNSLGPKLSTAAVYGFEVIRSKRTTVF